MHAGEENYALNSNRIRAGVLNLPVAGLVFTLFVWLRGPLVDPSADPAGFARAVTSEWLTFSWLAIMAGMVLLIFGFASLYIYLYLAERPLSRPAFVAMGLGGAGIAWCIMRQTLGV